jgi:mannose-6-phosphate isomerase-like protein (cupin superfamily)/8-oxo-dGTP pyrophosphatase MutT (NUDIX family)
VLGRVCSDSQMAENRPADRFRAGVGIVIRRGDGLVLAFERRQRPGSWQLPQGGIDEGESIGSATIRELFEETGIRENDVEVITDFAAWVGYELPAELRSPKTGRGQVHHWTLMAPRHSDLKPSLGDGEEFSAWEWMTIDDLVERTAQFRQPVYRWLQSQLPQAPTTPPALVRLDESTRQTAPDGSDVRILAGGVRGGLAEFILADGAVSIAVRHRTVDELWFVAEGTGTMWRRSAGVESADELTPGVSLSIPVGTAFQFRSSGPGPLRIIGTTMPPWPGTGEAEFVDDAPWTPTASRGV